MAQYNVISADAHIECSPELWVRRMPKALRDQAPQVVRLPEGGDAVSIAGGPPAPLGLQLTGGQKFSEFVTKGRTFAEKLPGSGDAAQRIKEQDQDGTDGELLFAAVVATSLRQIKNPLALKEIAKAYNAWLSEEYCSCAPERLLGVGVIPPTNAKDAVEELERIATLPGIVGAQLLSFPNGGDWATYGDEPFWAAANELGVPIVTHHNFGGEGKAKSHPMPGQGGDKALAIEGGIDLAQFAWLLTCDLPLPTLPILTIEQLFLGGVLDRYPKLRLHFAETGIGWLPYWLEQIDDRYERHRHWAKVRLNKLPTEYVRQHVTFSFQEDHAGIALRHSIGLDNICWASDFPHSVSDWPYSREVRERQFKGLPDDERRKIEGLNLVAHLGLISREEKERQAREPRPQTNVELLKIAGRGERRR